MARTDAQILYQLNYRRKLRGLPKLDALPDDYGTKKQSYDTSDSPTTISTYALKRLVKQSWAIIHKRRSKPAKTRLNRFESYFDNQDWITPHRFLNFDDIKYCPLHELNVQWQEQHVMDREIDPERANLMYSHERKIFQSEKESEYRNKLQEINYEIHSI